MKISVLLYESVPESDICIKEALEAYKITCTSVKNLSRMHILLSCRHFDAVIVNKATLNAYGIIPNRHLGDAETSLCIIHYVVSENKTLKTELCCISEEKTGDSVKTDKTHLREIIKAALESVIIYDKKGIRAVDSLAEIAENEKYCVFPENFEKSLHKKMRLVFRGILDSGRKGIQTNTITHLVWGPLSSDKRKDIQIYISRLRTILDKQYDKKFIIKFQNNRYTLLDRTKISLIKK